MKNQKATIASFIAFFCLVIAVACTHGHAKNTTDHNPKNLLEVKNQKSNKQFSSTAAKHSTRTTLIIKNATPDSVEVAVVLAALGGGCASDNPPVTADQLDSLGFCSNVVESGTAPYAGNCSFMLKGKESRTFPNLMNTCISGNITFGGFPACPDTAYPNGYSTAEFTLNPTQGAEAFDISLVNGYNYKISMSTSGGGAWYYGHPAKSITEIVTKPLGQNANNPGIYPKNCTDCVRLVGHPVCHGYSKHPSCQPSRICNVQRAYNDNGGTVTITLH